MIKLFHLSGSDKEFIGEVIMIVIMGICGVAGVYGFAGQFTN